MQKILVISRIENSKQPSRSCVDGQNPVRAIDDHDRHTRVAQYRFVNAAKLRGLNFCLSYVEGGWGHWPKKVSSAWFTPGIRARGVRQRSVVDRQMKWAGEAAINFPLLV